VLGGCDSLQVGAFDEVVRLPDEFSQRIARNQQLLLREECHLARVIDPAGGSWFVETLTEDLARRAWALFQEIEKLGGMAKALHAGWPQKEVAKVAAERFKNVARRRDGIIGTNHFANPTEKPLEVPLVDDAAFRKLRAGQVAAARAAVDSAQRASALTRLAGVAGGADAALFNACVEAAAAGATLGEIARALRTQDKPDEPVKPVALTRVASQFERLRRAVEAHTAKSAQSLKVFLANMGPLRQHKARADFARGYFEVAGFEVIVPPGFKTPGEAAAAALQSGAHTVCICSTDETYPALVPELVKALRAQQPDLFIILAGYPTEQVAAHQAAGVNDFIHIRANALEGLTHLAAKLGIQT
jgi:methylmalonyl-CoA mutase